MNVVHLNKYDTMKVYQIISEKSAWQRIGNLLGMGGRAFATEAEELIYRQATKDLSTAIYNAKLDVAKVKEWDIVKPYVQNTKYNNKEFVQMIYDDSLEMAKERTKKELADFKKKNPGSTTPPAGATGTTGKVAGALFDAIMAYGIYDSVKNPVDDYVVRKAWADHKLQVGPGNVDPKNPKEQGWTQDQYDSYIKEELGIMVSRIALTITPSLLQAPKTLLNLVSKIPLLKFLSMNYTAGDQVGRAVYLAWIEAINSDTPIPGTEGLSTDGKRLTAKQIITWALLADLPIPFVSVSIAKFVGSIAKLGVNAVNNTAKATQGKPLPEPETPKPLDQPAPLDSKFNPNDWVKTKSGYYQNKFNNKMITPTEYNQRAGGESSD